MVAGAAGASDERMMQLLRLLNRLLDKHPESRRRHLNFYTPAIVPVWMQVPTSHTGPPSPQASLHILSRLGLTRVDARSSPFDGVVLLVHMLCTSCHVYPPFVHLARLPCLRSLGCIVLGLLCKSKP